MTIRNACITILAASAICTSCALHSSKVLYRKFGKQKITSIEFSFGDSINARKEHKIVLDNSRLKNAQLSIASSLTVVLTSSKRTHFQRAATSTPDSVNTYLLIVVKTQKNKLLIWPYYEMIDFSRIGKGDALVSIGRIMDVLWYSNPVFYQDKELSNKYISIANEAIGHQNQAALDSSKSSKTINYLPLLK